MGLPARQRRVLENIESELRGSDPRLATMFVIFGRLTRDEEMPRIEELRHRAAMLLLRIRLVLGSVGTRLRPRRRQHQRDLRRRELRRGSRPRPSRPAYRYASGRPASARAAGGRPATRRQAGARSAHAQARARRLRRRIRVAVFFPVALALMTLTIFLVARFGSPARCGSVSAVATAKPHPRGKLITKGVRLCRPPALVPAGR
ncbi:MAG TPA: hypothetical protein VFV41_25715 [Streptosporangiaceae bacterium]|nr:hypothetical protein [Streptosporangiaceae bacterium]